MGERLLALAQSFGKTLRRTTSQRARATASSLAGLSVRWYAPSRRAPGRLPAETGGEFHADRCALHPDESAAERVVFPARARRFAARTIRWTGRPVLPFS